VVHEFTLLAVYPLVLLFQWLLAPRVAGRPLRRSPEAW
jgi:hypothetical protein